MGVGQNWTSLKSFSELVFPSFPSAYGTSAVLLEYRRMACLQVLSSLQVSNIYSRSFRFIDADYMSQDLV